MFVIAICTKLRFKASVPNHPQPETVFSKGHLPFCRYSVCLATPAVTLKGSDFQVHLSSSIDKGHISSCVLLLINSYSTAECRRQTYLYYRISNNTEHTNNIELTDLPSVGYSDLQRFFCSIKQVGLSTVFLTSQFCPIEVGESKVKGEKKSI